MAGAGRLCPPQLAMVAVGPCQATLSATCLDSARGVLQRPAHSGKDRFGQSFFASMSGERPVLVVGLGECHSPALGWWDGTPDPRAFWMPSG